jgi:hypothetical protein
VNIGKELIDIFRRINVIYDFKYCIIKEALHIFEKSKVYCVNGKSLGEEGMLTNHLYLLRIRSSSQNEENRSLISFLAGVKV